MNITCDNCKSKFHIDANKIPPGKTASLHCPQCGHKILIKPHPPHTGVISSVHIPSSSSEKVSEDPVSHDDALNDTPPDFNFHNGKAALICENDLQLRTKIQIALKTMGYTPHTCDITRDAIKKLRFHAYDLVILNEMFDTHHIETNGVQIYIAQLDTSRRRDIFAVLMGRKFQTLDRMTAFNKSFNIVINTAQINNLENILAQGIKKHDAFYRIFKETLHNRRGRR
jgi:predicted Zn finger-like uncharacterized protein